MDNTQMPSITDKSPGIIKEYYGVTLIKSLLDVNVMKKMIVVMEQTNNEELALATLHYIFAAAVEVAGATGPYVPVVCPDTLLTVLKTAVSKLSNETYLHLLDTGKLGMSLTIVIDRLEHKAFDIRSKQCVTNCIKAFTEMREIAQADVGFKAGYDSASLDNSDVVSGNALLKTVGKVNISPSNDLRNCVFTDLVNSTNVKIISNIETASKSVLASISTDARCSGVIEGANHADAGAGLKIRQYISEVISICSNLGGATSTLEKASYNLDCLVTENLTSENYVSSVSTAEFGWSHESLITANECKVHALTESILGMAEGTLKEDILLKQRSPEDNNVERATLEPDSLLTITGKNIQYILGAAAQEKEYGNRKMIAEKLSEAIINTALWESTNENYSDMPVFTYFPRSAQILENLTKNTIYYDNLMETLGIVRDKMKNQMEGAETGVFNPAPTLNSITPMPVEARTTQLAFNSVARADTDEEMDSAMLEFAKIHASMELFNNKVIATQKDVDNSIKNVKRILEKYAADYNKDPYKLDKFLKYAKDLRAKYPSMRSDNYVKSNKMPVISIKQMPYNSDMGENCAIFSIGNYDEDILRCLEPIIKDLAKDVSEEKSVASDGIIKSITVDASNLNLVVVKHQKITHVNEGAGVVEEASKAGKVARAASREVQKKEEKVIRKRGGAAHEVKQAVKNAIDPMEKYINQMFQKAKKADADERREILIKGGTMPKIRRWVKRSIGLAAGAAVGTVIPVAATISGIALIAYIATDKMLDAKEKRKIIRELEDEINIVNEKIDDSRSDENKQNKYELMRIRNELERTKDRILLNLKE